MARILIGSVESLHGQASVRHADGSTELLHDNSLVYTDDVVLTGKDSRVSLVFWDGSRMEIGPEFTATLDQGLFNPAAYTLAAADIGASVTVSHIGVVTALDGEVELVRGDGTVQVLAVGDFLYTDDVIRTAPDSHAELTMLNGSTINLGPDFTARLDDELFPSQYPAFLSAGIEDAEFIRQAILAGKDPAEFGRAPAAGAETIAEDAGHSFVRLDPSGRAVTPESGYETTPLSYGFSEMEEELLLSPQDIIPPDAIDLDLHVADEPVNLVIVLDKSGSMVADPGVEGFETRFDLAREAVRQLLDAYNQNSDVHVLLVDFSSGNLTFNSGWLALPDALEYLEAIELRGFTDYQEALLQVREAFNAPGDPTPPAHQTLVYFLSDGDPQGRGGALDGALTSDDVIAWEAFLSDPANNITRAYAVGIGDDLRPLDDDRNQLDEVAFPNGESDNPVILTEAELIPNLLATVQDEPVTGNLITETGSGTAFATEGVQLQSLEVDGITYRYDADNDQITGGASGPVTGSVLTVVTGLGGELGFDFSNGDYSYAIPGVDTDSQETFVYTVIDSDGLIDSANFTVHVTAISTVSPVSEVLGGAGVDVIYGSAGNDILNGADGDDILIGAYGNDELTGDSGADTFVIRSLNEGVDNITDFNPDEQDVLDLSGLLVESDPDDVLANIGNYLSAKAGETGTSIAIDPAGGSLFTGAEIATLSSVTTGQIKILIGEYTQATLDIV